MRPQQRVVHFLNSVSGLSTSEKQRRPLFSFVIPGRVELPLQVPKTWVLPLDERIILFGWASQDSNLKPFPYEGIAQTVELQARFF